MLELAVEQTGVGDGALNAGGDTGNTAVGYHALFNDTATGNANTAVGDQALLSNTTGSINAAFGFEALQSNTTGSDNSAFGFKALLNNTTGMDNTALGTLALLNNTTGSNNVAIGFDAGLNIVTANDVIAIGAFVDAADVSNTTWIKNIYGVTTISGTTAPVIVSQDGQLGTVSSSARFKKDIADMGKSSEAILSLRPVTFHYKNDANAVAQFGLIAEEVEKVDPDLIIRDKEGKPYSVRYEAVNAMLLNKFLKAHKKIEDLQATIAELQATVAEQRRSFQLRLAEQQKEIEALTSGLQRVSAQLDLAPKAFGAGLARAQTVANK